MHKTRAFDGKKLGMFRDFKKFLLIVLIVIVVLRFVIGFKIVSGVSMCDTLHDGEVVIYTRINPSVKRGDIVAVSLPSGEHYVKRVLGVAGDVIDIRDGILYINGEAETGNYWLGKTMSETAAGALSYPLTVPETDLFIVGDNREESTDSRRFGTVNKRTLEGVLRLCFGKWFVKFL